MTYKQKKQLEVSKHLMLLGNIAAGALIFGQATSEFPFRFGLALLGLILVFGLYGIALIIMRGGERR